jgi:hypothetical protein
LDFADRYGIKIV